MLTRRGTVEGGAACGDQIDAEEADASTVPLRAPAAEGEHELARTEPHAGFCGAEVGGLIEEREDLPEAKQPTR